MGSTFAAFEVARKALNASQKGLEVVSQNISNINTDGYTRQRVVLSAVSPQTTTLISDTVATRVGQGVQIDGITQLRDSYLDFLFRKENSNNAAWNTSLDGLKEISSVLDEYNTEGLNATVQDFFAKLHTVSLNTSSVEYASLLRTSALKITQVLNKNATQLKEIQERTITELNINVNEINSLLSKIEGLNKTIKGESQSKSVPNELLDKRNYYLDQLSGYVNITVEPNTNGTVAIKSGNTYLLDSTGTINNLSVDDQSEPIRILNSDGTNFIPSGGAAFSNLEVLNGRGIYSETSGDEFPGIPYYQVSLDYFAKAFADVFNDLNSLPETEKPLFTSIDSTEITAANICLTSQWLNDPMYLTTSKTTAGNNDNIIAMIQARNLRYPISSKFKGTFEEYVTSLNLDIASDVNFYQDMADTSDISLSAAMDERESISGVSIDEESINLIKFQKSYAAAARVMTTLDEALDLVINRMGTVGR